MTLVHSAASGSIPVVDGAGVAYHGSPITPRAVLEAMGERDYCVSFYRPASQAGGVE